MTNIAAVEEELKARFDDTLDKAREISEKTYRNIGRGLQRVKVAGEEAVEEVRDEIKQRPLATVALVGAGTFALGVLAGWLLSRKLSSRS